MVKAAKAAQRSLRQSGSWRGSKRLWQQSGAGIEANAGAEAAIVGVLPSYVSEEQ